MKIFILGHEGMLGHMVFKYLSTKEDCELITTDLRWPSEEFKKKVLDFNGDFIVNCIGAIHQRTDNFDVNVELPIWLDINMSCNIIHPGTDYEKDNCGYGSSKRKSSQYIVKSGSVTKIIKTSIIGPEINSNFCTLEWFLNSKESVDGWINNYWNGNTTLQWAKESYKMMKKWDDYDVCTKITSECISKYELLNVIKNVFNKEIDINKFDDEKVNRCLDSDIITPTIMNQLKELKEFYYDN